MYTSVSRRSGLTLMELLVVMAVLVALAALIIPRISGVTDQAASSTNASIVSDVDNAVGSFEARYSSAPQTWDGLVPIGGSVLYTKLNPNVQPLLKVLQLDANQAASLTSTGVSGCMVVNESFSGLPSDAAKNDYLPIASNAKVAALVKQPFTGHGSTFVDRAFNILPVFGSGGSMTENPNEFVVLGVGLSSSLRGKSIQNAPTIQSAQPTKYYARVLCVYKVPPTGSSISFKAQYVGAFLPDGTCAKENVDNFNQSQ